MGKMFNIENCDVTMENGYLRMIYHTDKLLMPITLAIGKSYHDLNEKGMYLFGQEDWAKNVVEWSIRKESPIWHNLLADIYKNHHDLYSSIMVTPEDDEYDDVIGYLPLEVISDVDEKTGHRIAHFNAIDLAALDTGILHAFADAFAVEDSEYMDRDELIELLSQQDIDMDECDYDCDDCDCAEKTAEGNVICHQDEDEEDDDGEDLCDHNCVECDCAEDSSYGGYICHKGDTPIELFTVYTSDEDDKAEPVTQPDAQQYEYVNGPAHYHGTECIENMRKLYGDEAVRWFCICNAYKYRFRNGSKPGVSAEQDREKADWYENYAANMMGEQRYY